MDEDGREGDEDGDDDDDDDNDHRDSSNSTNIHDEPTDGKHMINYNERFCNLCMGLLSALFHISHSFDAPNSGKQQQIFDVQS